MGKCSAVNLKGIWTRRAPARAVDAAAGGGGGVWWPFLYLAEAVASAASMQFTALKVEDTVRRLSYLADELQSAAPHSEADDMSVGSPTSLSDVWRFFQEPESTEPISSMSPHVQTAATFDWHGLHGNHMRTSPVRQTPLSAKTFRQEGPPCKRPCYDVAKPVVTFSFTDTRSPTTPSSSSGGSFSFTGHFCHFCHFCYVYKVHKQIYMFKMHSLII